MASPVFNSFREAFLTLLRPIASFMSRHEILSHQVIITEIIFDAMVGGVMASMASYISIFIMVPLAMVIGMAFRALAVMLYREHETKVKASSETSSPLGLFLREFGDVFADVALYLPFALLPEVSPTLVILMVFLSILGEMSGLIPLRFGATRRTDGPLSHGDRSFIMALVGLSLGLGAPTWVWINLVMGSMIVLSLWTIIHRVFYALREADETRVALSPGLDREFSAEAALKQRRLQEGKSR
jgi:CDP-diacylglycerol--glycerol-3-phosphate 3-phosphatidyltransferase